MTVRRSANGSSCATRGRCSLDRHWRNARTLASHNPVIYKPRIIGDFIVNGRTAKSFYDRNRNAAATVGAPPQSSSF
jgi:hypothetical protein